MRNIFKKKPKIKTDYTLIETDKKGFNYNHYKRVVDARKERGLSQRRNHLNKFEHKDRDGKYRIDGTLIKSVHHPLHDKLLVDEKGNKYQIDVVTEDFYYGRFISIMYRKLGTKSHGCLYWENISSIDEIVINSVKKNKKRFKLINV
jgi:hypothetical protein